MIQVSVLRTEEKDANALLVMLHASQLCDCSEARLVFLSRCSF